MRKKGRADNMTKAELIEDVSCAVETTRKDSKVIVEAIFDGIVPLCTVEIRSRSGVLESSVRGSANRVWDGSKTGARWKFQPNASLISSPARK